MAKTKLISSITKSLSDYALVPYYSPKLVHRVMHKGHEVGVFVGNKIYGNTSIKTNKSLEGLPYLTLKGEEHLVWRSSMREELTTDSSEKVMRNIVLAVEQLKLIHVKIDTSKLLRKVERGKVKNAAPFMAFLGLTEETDITSRIITTLIKQKVIDLGFIYSLVYAHAQDKAGVMDYERILQKIIFSVPDEALLGRIFELKHLYSSTAVWEKSKKLEMFLAALLTNQLMPTQVLEEILYSEDKAFDSSRRGALRLLRTRNEYMDMPDSWLKTMFQVD